MLTDTIKTDNHVAVGEVGSYFGITKLPFNLGDIMNKNEYRILEHENLQLRTQIFYLNSILDKIEDWLESEIENNEPVVEGEEELSDGTEDIYAGRNECAKSLLEQIKKWESEDE